MTRRSAPPAATCVVSMAFSVVAVCPIWPPVSDLTVMELLKIAQMQGLQQIALPGVTGRVGGYDYANATARHFNVTQLGRGKKFLRYCRFGRKDTIEVQYRISAILSTLWWKAPADRAFGDNEAKATKRPRVRLRQQAFELGGAFDATVEDVDVTVLFVLRRSPRKGTVRLCADEVDLSTIGAPIAEAKSFNGEVDRSLRHAANQMYASEVDRLTSGLRRILRRSVFSCVGPVAKTRY
ncbi:uncharacterized protein [Dermacentor andersoni]|uniref:uncharacterized protein n=1 Tax=Dermacentor andersoni TaxID=34620 RepID=UPI002417A2D9|nr:uncharacterized protein LOC126534659 [Dermacentor andersoni]XP_054928507.1 uncharacterized protein LOC126534659 [Dermacentor andersoni]